MRRHIALLVLIVAIVIAIALFRPQRQVRTLSAKQQFAESRIESLADDVTLDDKDGAEHPQSPSSNDGTEPLQSPSTELAQSDVVAKKDAPVDRGMGPYQYLVAVTDPEGRPVENACVVIFKSVDIWMTYETKEVRTDGDGRVVILRDFKEKVLLHIYKPGTGQATYVGLAHVGPKSPMDPKLIDAPVELRAGSPVKIRCTDRYGNARGGAEVTVTAELNVGSRRYPDRPLEIIWIQYPPRRVLADEWGVCEIDALPNYGPIGDGKTTWPGCRFTISGKWKGHSAELKFDNFPKNEVHLLIE